MGTEIVNWEDRLSSFAQEATATETVGGSFVGLAAGRLTLAGAPVAGNKLSCIITAAVHENAYYPGAYDKDNRQPPVCYAFGESDEDMKPHEKSLKPQHADCAGCPQNQFGSKGKGKACKNVRRLALIPADSISSADTIAEAETIYLKPPVMSTKNWQLYVNTLSGAHKRPPFAVITEVSTEPDPKSQFKVTFTFKERIEGNEQIQALVAKHELAKAEIGFAYPTPVEAKQSEKF